MAVFVSGLTITQTTPGNQTSNGSRSVNFTFTPVWDNAGDQGATSATSANCSIWTNITGTWGETQTNGTSTGASNGTSWRILNNSVSWINTTFSADGYIMWSVRCYNTSASLTGSEVNFSLNRTLIIDSQAPVLFGVRPNNTFGAGWAPGGVNTSGFYTSYADMEFRINISDNNTRAVWYTFNSLPGGAGANESSNRTMSIVEEANGIAMWNASFRNLVAFNSNFTGPGPHSVFFCANDSVGRISCSQPNDFVISGVNITQIEQEIAGMPQIGGGGFGGLNITYGNGTEIPYGEFINPAGGANLTFIFNFTPDVIIHIVGGRIDEKQFGNASQSKINSTPTREVKQQVGTGMRGQTAWADIGSFIPSNVNYEYGIIQMGGIGYSKKMYCNGTSMGDPLCHKINQCNSTVFGLFNHSIVIPTNDGCWLDSTQSTVVINGETKAAGFTFMFVDKFSGGVGGSDFGPVNATFSGPLYNGFNFSGQTKTRLINFSVNDINSTGINLTKNGTVNLTITLGTGLVGFFSYINSTNTNLTCVPDDGGVFNNVASPGNSTIVTCNVTFKFQFNGTYLLNVSAIDDSNNTNPMNATQGFINVILDDIPPVIKYFNITNSSTFNASGSYDEDNETKTYDNTPGGSIRQGGRIHAVSNWTDNLTAPLEADLQFFNVSSGQWVVANTTGSTTNVTPKATNVAGWANLTFVIPADHDEFEGENVTFRIVANDTLGNRNVTTAGMGNITILINDTTAPRLRVTVGGHIDVNGTNTSDTTPTIFWNVTERSSLLYIALQFDALTDQSCNQLKNFTTQASANANMNGSLTLSETGGCSPLGNGTHIVRLTAVDSWSNTNLYIHNFTVETGTPNITLTALSNGFSAVNQSNATPYTGLNFTVVNGATSNISYIKNFTWVSSCNGTVQAIIGDALLINNSMIWPFNYTNCKGMEANQTVNVTVNDVAGNSQSKVYQFLVDEVGPSLAVHAPTNGFSGTSNLTINLSAQDGNQRISFFGYFLDGNDLSVILNASENIEGAGTNISLLNNTNFSVGRHTIKFTVNDTLGNRRNSSSITFTAVGPVLGSDINVSLADYLIVSNNYINMTNVTVKIKNSAGSYDTFAGANDTNNTYQIVITITKSNETANVTLTDINGSAANWAAINFSMTLNNTGIQQGIRNNWTSTVLAIVHFNESINEFLPDYNSYYGAVTLNLNISGDTGTAQQIWWIPNSTNLTTRTNISQCTGGFTRTSTTPCWNYTSGGATNVYVPHFSDVVGVNDTKPPTVTINNPQTPQRIISFVPNITVSADALNCSYTYNMSGGAVTERITMTLETFGDGTHICSGPRINNLTNNLSINFSFYVYDTSSNLNETSNFTLINDTTTAGMTTITESGLSSTEITVSITSNETVNMSINSTGSTAFTNPTAVATFTQSQSITISSLTASTVYNYTVLICDRASNCLLNTTLGFTTSAAAATSTSTTTSSSGGGGGGAVPVTSNVVSSTAKVWSTITPDAPAKITIAKEQIAVSEISIEVGTTVSNVEVKVEALKSNPKKAEPASKVYQYIEITKSNLANADIKKANVNFKVAKSWLSKNGVGESDVALYRYADSAWNQLKTIKTGDDANNVLYEAETPGFSTFAVGTRAAPEKPAETAPTQPTTPTGEVTGTTPTTPTGEEVTVPEVPAPTKGKGTTVAVVIVAIVLVALLAGYWYKKKASK